MVKMWDSKVRRCWMATFLLSLVSTIESCSSGGPATSSKTFGTPDILLIGN